MTAVTLRCVPAFRLRGVDAHAAARGGARRASTSASTPTTTSSSGRSRTRRSRSRAPTTARTSPVERAGAAPRAWLHDVLLDNHALELLSRTGRRFPRAIPRINRLAARGRLRAASASTASHRIFASPRLVRFDEMEYAIPREHAADAVRGAREILERHPVNFPVELRFVAADDALLSPAHGRDTAYVAVHVFDGMDGERAVPRGRAADGRLGRPPALGQALLPRRPRAQARATRRWDAFAAARAELDPDGRFENAWARRALGAGCELQERAALAAVGRRPSSTTSPPRTRCTASKRSHSSPALAWRNQTRSPTRRRGARPRRAAASGPRRRPPGGPAAARPGARGAGAGRAPAAPEAR